MKFPESFLEELRARTPLAALIGRRVKLSRSGRQMKGCCPFHGEKTPSFYVYEDGYHCFGCGAHGDAISFVMQTEGSSFPEAVAALAGAAGLDLPRPGPGEAAAERRRLDLHAVLEAAQRHYRAGLGSPEGAAALAYLRQRGLTEATIARFGLGWSGAGRGALAASLGGEGITPAQLLEAGLLRAGEDGAVRGELFFNRVMFPIRDRTGRLVSFGGRTLGDGQPKYVNGPETPVFSKRRTLYGLDFAREAVRKGAVLVVVEGYMDVIALHQAGFGAAVAPLGTALTAEQLEALWRLSPSPILCFDGDGAGARAAERAVQVALPGIESDRTVRIAYLEQGEDPDTCVRRGGGAAFALVAEAALPLDEALFNIIRGQAALRTPEDSNGFRKRLAAGANTIRDRGLAAEYRRRLVDRSYAMLRRKAPSAHPTPLRPKPVPGTAHAVQALILSGILLHHPELSRDLEDAYSSVALPADLQTLRGAILDYIARQEVLDSQHLVNHLNTLGFSAQVDAALRETPMAVRAGAQPADIYEAWGEVYGLLNREGLRRERDAALHKYMSDLGNIEAWQRCNGFGIALFNLQRGDPSGEDQEHDA